MSPVRTAPYPPYDVAKIIAALRSPRSDHLLIAAHRGSRFGGVTENSTAAVAAAARAGCECIEVDVRLSRDGVPVILHDDGLGRILALEGEEEQYNPFTGKGYSPLVCDTNWEGEGGMKQAYLRDENGDKTGEHPMSLEEMLDFIHIEGINIVVMLDVKDIAALAPSQAVLARYRNAAGVPALLWNIFKLDVTWYPSPAELEAQHWVRSAREGEGFLYIPVYEAQLTRNMDVIASIRTWEPKDYVVAFEIGLHGTGGLLQDAADYLRTTPRAKGMGGFQPKGDLPLSFYAGRPTSWDDQGFREEILAGGFELPRMFYEFREITTSHRILGPDEAPRGVDDRDNLDWSIANGFNWLIADFVQDLAADLERRGRRNTRALCREKA